jgi:hypothetical protein
MEPWSAENAENAHIGDVEAQNEAFKGLWSGVAMSNQHSFKIGSFCFAAFVPKKIECKRF